MATSRCGYDWGGEGNGVRAGARARVCTLHATDHHHDHDGDAQPQRHGDHCPWPSSNELAERLFELDNPTDQGGSVCEVPSLLLFTPVQCAVCVRARWDKNTRNSCCCCSLSPPQENRCGGPTEGVLHSYSARSCHLRTFGALFPTYPGGLGTPQGTYPALTLEYDARWAPWTLTLTDRCFTETLECNERCRRRLVVVVGDGNTPSVASAARACVSEWAGARVSDGRSLGYDADAIDGSDRRYALLLPSQ